MCNRFYFYCKTSLRDHLSSEVALFDWTDEFLFSHKWSLYTGLIVWTLKQWEQTLDTLVWRLSVFLNGTYIYDTLLLNGTYIYSDKCCIERFTHLYKYTVISQNEIFEPFCLYLRRLNSYNSITTGSKVSSSNILRVKCL